MQLPRFILSLVVFASLAMASLPASATKPVDTGEKITVNMRNADIKAVIQWVAEQTNKAIVIDPRVTGRISILASEPMSVPEVYELFLTAMDVYGYAAVDSNGILRIMPASLLQSSPVSVVDSLANVAQGETVIHLVKTNQVSPLELVQRLQPLMPKTAYLGALPESGAILIADQADSVQRLVTLIQQLDQQANIDFDVISVKHADAKALSGVIASLLKSDNSNLGVAVSHEERSNSLLVSGESHLRNRVRALAAQLDRPVPNTGGTRVVYLHYMEAEELLPVVRGMTASLQEDNKDQQSMGFSVNIEASESANALIITAPPTLLDEIETVISQLDIRRAQVLVEAVIVEVSESLSTNLGVEWNTNLARDNDPETLTQFGLRPTETFTEDTVAELLGLGLTLGFYRKGSLRTLVRALSSDDNSNILSTPSVIALDNQPAEILVGSNVPFISGQVTNPAAETENPFTTIERQDIGVSLKITPHINAGDSVTLSIEQEVENIANSAVAADIITNKRSINTKVLVEDDSILVIGGLLAEEDLEQVNKVPVLGDIPLLGALFRSTSTQKVKKNLMVFIHPVIIENDTQADTISAQRYNQIRSLQKNFNEKSGPSNNSESPLLPEFETLKPAK